LDSVQDRLAQAGLCLPEPPKPAGTYTPFLRLGTQLLVAGQTCLRGGVLQYEGIVGDDLSIPEAQEAAQLCALNALATAGLACDGDFGRVRLVKMTGYVRCAADFAEQPRVLDGASETFVLALGERGKHVRAAIGTHALTRRAPVEIETLFELL
jgi:enamine deaminase RidA (YjgF/YER057c/UK114 family)